ncbi:hypothetical protein VPH35_007258 [Triticum aestivum]
MHSNLKLVLIDLCIWWFFLCLMECTAVFLSKKKEKKYIQSSNSSIKLLAFNLYTDETDSLQLKSCQPHILTYQRHIITQPVKHINSSLSAPGLVKRSHSNL